MSEEPTDHSSNDLAAFLANRDVDCPVCGYNLRDLRKSICAECGNAIELGVHVSHRTYAPWFLMVLFAGFGTPFGAISVITVIAATQYGRWAVPPFWLGIALAGFTLTVPILVLSLLMRRRFLRMLRPAQWTIAILVAFLSAGSFIALGLYGLLNG